MLISKAFYTHLPIFLNLFKCPLRCLICVTFEKKTALNDHLMAFFFEKKMSPRVEV
jgi:hypothetical protein